MLQQLVRLWRGEIELRRAFWDYAAVYGTLANLTTTVAAFAVVAANGPATLAVVIFLLPLPYNVLVVIGVWRSADRYRGPASRAHLARIAVVVWAVLATLL